MIHDALIDTPDYAIAYAAITQHTLDATIAIDIAAADAMRCRHAANATRRPPWYAVLPPRTYDATYCFFYAY